VFRTRCAESLFAESKLNFFILSANLILRESHIVNCLKSFDFNF